jgi:transposase
MKVQDVLLKAMAKKITWWGAAEIIGVTDRTMRRWRRRLERDGYTGLADRRRGKPSAQRIPLATVEKVLGLYKETYYDLNIRHFHEKLRDEHAMELSYTWVQRALQGAGLVAKLRRLFCGGYYWERNLPVNRPRSPSQILTPSKTTPRGPVPTAKVSRLLASLFLVTSSPK